MLPTVFAAHILHVVVQIRGCVMAPTATGDRRLVPRLMLVTAVGVSSPLPHDAVSAQIHNRFPIR